MRGKLILEARSLTPAEVELTRSVFGGSIDTARVTVRRRKWFPLQPRETVMAPSGHLHFHPKTSLYCADFACENLQAQGLFIHEMTHVWQHQRGVWLPAARHPFCRYHYSLKPGWPLARYGIEQQAEIVRHAFLKREGAAVAGAPPLEQYLSLLPFGQNARETPIRTR